MPKPPGLALVRRDRTNDHPKPPDPKEKLFRAKLRFGPIGEREIECSSISHMHFEVRRCALKFLRTIDSLHPGRLKKESLRKLRHRITVHTPVGHPVKEYFIFLSARELLPAVPPESL